MATVIDLLRHLGEHAAPDGGNALAGPVVLPGVSDSTLSLPLPPPLIAAWSRATHRPTLGHHALALSTAQANYSVALMGHGVSPQEDLLLLAFNRLLAPAQPSILCILPTDDSLRSALIALADALNVRWIDVSQRGSRINQAQLVIATPGDLHRYVLRYHDRAWRWLWPRLQAMLLPHLDKFAGAEAGHLHWLLRRVERLAPHAPLQIFGALAPVADADAALARLLDRRVMLIAAPDRPAHNTLIALWRCGTEREGARSRLVEQLTARRLALTVLGRDAAETQHLRTALREAGYIPPEDARVAIVSGLPSATEERQALLRAGYRLLIVLAGDEPHELLFAAQPDLLLQELPRWPLATTNPYISVAELACAAAERPLEQAEVDRWNVRDLRDRLIRKRTLQALPNGDLWQIAPQTADPYDELDPRAVAGSPSIVYAPDGSAVGAIPPALLDRCALPGQVVAPGLEVAARDDDRQVVQLRIDPTIRATLVLADVEVNVREELAARTVRFGKVTADLVKGKVLAAQNVRGLRELRPDGTQRRSPINPPMEAQWSAAACWIAIAVPPADPATVGWALMQALPLISLAEPSAIVHSYDAALHRLYLIEVEPGGVGVINCIYDQFEQLVDTAINLASACAQRPLFRAVAETETAWLRQLREPAQKPEGAPSRLIREEREPAEPDQAAEAPLPIGPAYRERLTPSIKPRMYAEPSQTEEQTPPIEAEPEIADAELAATTEIVLPPAPESAPARRRAAIYAARLIDVPVAAATPSPPKPIDSTPDNTETESETQELEHYTGQAVHVPEPAAESDEAVESTRVAERVASTAQYSIDDLLPPIDADDVDEEAEAAPPEPPEETTIEPRPERLIDEQRRAQPMRSSYRRGPPARPAPTNRRSEQRRTPQNQRLEPSTRPNRPPVEQRRQAAPPVERRTQPPPASPNDPARTATPKGNGAPPRAPEAEQPADVNAMIARMRRLREQREAEQQTRAVPQRQVVASREPAELRFHIGQRVQCLPYGVGTVRASRIVDGREQVLIDFPEYGEIDVDPAISLVRPLTTREEGATEADEDMAS